MANILSTSAKRERAMVPVHRHYVSDNPQGWRAIDVAEQFIARFYKTKTSVTNLKLQKLLYYAQGWSIGLFNKKMFPEPVEAWKYGPVVESVYHTYSHFKFTPIETSVPEVRKVITIDAAFKVYGHLSASELSRKTHLEPPWQNSYREGAFNIPIEAEKLRDYFHHQALADSTHQKFLNLWQEDYGQVYELTSEHLNEIGYNADLDHQYLAELNI